MLKKSQVSDYFLVGIALIIAVLVFKFIGISPKILLFFLALAVFFTAFIKIDWAFIILIFAMLFSPEIKLSDVPSHEVVVRIDDILLMVVFFGWLARMAINKELGLLKTTPLNTLMISYVATCIISTIVGLMTGRVRSLGSFFFYS